METRIPTLDPDVWRNLPVHLLEHIVAFLPIPAQSRFRTVNKRFNTWLSSLEFSVLSKELPLQKFVVLWHARQVIGPAPSDLVEYTQRGGFASLQRPSSRIFNADCLRPFMTELLEWDINIEATTRCFMCISCEAQEPRTARRRRVEEVDEEQSNKSNIDKVLVLDLTNNDVREIPYDVALCFYDGSSDTDILRVVSMQFNMIAVHENDRDFRFVNVLVTTDDRGVVLMLYDSVTKRSVKFGDIFGGLEYGRRVFLQGSCCATFDRVFILNADVGGPRENWRLTSFSYTLTDRNHDGRMDVDIEFPDSILFRLYTEMKLITTSDRVFVLGSSLTELSLWYVDLAKLAFVECDDFKIVGILAHHMSFVGSYSDYLVFGPEMNNCPSDKLGRYEFTGFKVYDLKRKEWRDLTQIKDKSISEPTSDLDDLHLEYFYDPYIESFNNPR